MAEMLLLRGRKVELASPSEAHTFVFRCPTMDMMTADMIDGVGQSLVDWTTEGTAVTNSLTKARRRCP